LRRERRLVCRDEVLRRLRARERVARDPRGGHLGALLGGDGTLGGAQPRHLAVELAVRRAGGGDERDVAARRVVKARSARRQLAGAAAQVDRLRGANGLDRGEAQR
jgi:hypothetical protein